MKYVRDTTGRFTQRPHYDPIELDQECEKIIMEFMQESCSGFVLPIPTDALTKLIERDTADLDLYADLAQEGADVEGVTYFFPDQKPSVRIAKALSEQSWGEHRLRTTLTHEYGHVGFHDYLWKLELPSTGMFHEVAQRTSPKCRRETILNASVNDWMEWQAGYISGAFLMPVTSLKRLVSGYFEHRGLYGQLKVNSPDAVDLIAVISDSFYVSRDAARVRLLKLGYVTEGDVSFALF